MLLTRFLPSKLQIQIMYFLKHKRFISFKNPRTFNDKIQWLKLYDYDTSFSRYVDKYLVRDFVSEKIGSNYLINLIRVYNSPNEIEWNEMPNRFVIKWNHGSGSNIFINNKSEIDPKFITKELRKMGKRNWYWYGREMPYKYISKKIIIEELLDNNGEQINDYKFHCFNGEPLYIQVDIDRFTNHTRNIYDLNWNLINAKIQFNNSSKIIDKPDKLDEMIAIAKILSCGFKYIRIDLYFVCNKIYFGEMTFYHGSGFEKILPLEFSLELGSQIII